MMNDFSDWEKVFLKGCNKLYPAIQQRLVSS